MLRGLAGSCTGSPRTALHCNHSGGWLLCVHRTHFMRGALGKHWGYTQPQADCPALTAPGTMAAPQVNAGVAGRAWQMADAAAAAADLSSVSSTLQDLRLLVSTGKSGRGGGWHTLAWRLLLCRLPRMHG